ncbi:hypothetical protein K525DRAFT_195703 [Schizophyllum commune Loenen D]|nr:hypothetical protein K525DRAFT_195703 [Schizophyllum commune Loenen D]
MHAPPSCSSCTVSNLWLLSSLRYRKSFIRVGAHGSAQSPSFDTTPPRTIWGNPFGPGPEILPSTASASASSATTPSSTILSGETGPSGTFALPPTTTIPHTRVHTNAQGGLSTQVGPTRGASSPGHSEQGLPPHMCGSASECGAESGTASSASGVPTMGWQREGLERLESEGQSSSMASRWNGL